MLLFCCWSSLFCNPRDCSPPGSFVHEIPRQEEWSALLFQEIFPTQGSNLRLLPSREQFVRIWRALQKTVPPDGLATEYLPLLRSLAAALGGADPFLRSAICLAVFAERGLLDSCRTGDQIRLRLTDRGKKVALEQSTYLQRLRNISDRPHRGGEPV